MIKTEIKDRSDIEKLVISFYDHAKEDELIGHIFTEIIPLDWNKHIPLICDFWETILLNANKYKRDTIEIHKAVNNKIKLDPEHFNRWLEIFNHVIDHYFIGEKADLAKIRALSIATMIQIKLSN